MARATIDDVARLAGVSIKTVSRVANQEPNVRDSTRVKVANAIATLDYKPNQSARSLASRQSFLIGLLYDDQSKYEIPSAGYVINIQSGVMSACKARNYDLLIHPCTYRNKDISKEIDELIRHSRLDGLVLAPPLSDMLPIIDAIEETGVPLARIAPGSNVNQQCVVTTNDRSACANMVNYLVSLGHKRIAFITGHPDHKAVANRYLGYQDGLQENAIALDTELVQSGDNSIKSGEKCAEALLAGKQHPTAIFACNDDMAAGVIRVAHRRGIRVPEKLSVVGFDDIPLAQQVFPALTTTRQPLKAMAKKATELLIRKLRAEPLEAAPTMVESSLVVRESSGKSPAI